MKTASKKIQGASPLNGAVESIDEHLFSKHKLELIEDPWFEVQGNFTICHIRAKKKNGKTIYNGYGSSKRNNCDPKNHYLGRKMALSRAVSSLLGHSGKNGNGRKKN